MKGAACAAKARIKGIYLIFCAVAHVCGLLAIRAMPLCTDKAAVAHGGCVRIFPADGKPGRQKGREEIVSAVEQTVAREARADVPKAEEAETTVSAEQTVVARAADSVRDREEAVALQMLYSLRS